MNPDTPRPPAFANLFAPFTLAGRLLRNRIAHASISTSSAEGMRVSDRLVNYHANRARGGAGMIIGEPVNGAPHQQVARRACAWNDSDLAGLARWADAVEREDCRLLVQIQDPGRGRHTGGRNPNAIGASALPDDMSWTVPHALTAGEVRRLVEDFARSAARLQRCGFSGVEISGAHGHLFHQFMSAWSNVRTDEYGGDLDGRLRIVRELIDAIRAECGTRFILGVKIPGEDGVPGGINIDEACRIGRHLTREGKVDYLSLGQGSHHRSLDMHIPDGHWPRVPYRALAAQLRAAVPGVPVMSIGRITDPAEAEAILAAGDADLIGIGRALVTDPAWPAKARDGRSADIRYCVGGNACWNTIIYAQPILCDNNPRVGAADEVTWTPPRTPERKRVVVVGAGVAGLEAAWIAAARGHDVTVIGASTEPGGKARLHAALPGSESVSSVYDWQTVAAQQAGVRFRLGDTIDLQGLIALDPQSVILATGATMTWPRIWGDPVRTAGLVPDLRSLVPELLRRRGREPGTAVLLDMDHTEGTYAAAQLLAQRFDRVIVATPREAIAQEVAVVTRQGILRRYHGSNIDVLTFAEPRLDEPFFAGEALAIEHVYGGTIRRVDDLALLTYASPRRPNDELLVGLQAAGITVRAIGDCRVARGLMSATAEGNAAGLAI